MAGDSIFDLKGGWGKDSGASYSVGAQDFTPAWTAKDTTSGVLAGQMDPIGALAAYLGIKKAAIKATGPTASSQGFIRANEEAAKPIEALLTKLTTQTGGPLIGKNGGSSAPKFSSRGDTADYVSGSGGWEERARQRELQQDEDAYLRQQREMERKQIALGMAQEEEELRASKQRNATRKNVLTPAMIQGILARLMKSF